jgi:hypothetical protein
MTSATSAPTTSAPSSAKLLTARLRPPAARYVAPGTVRRNRNGVVVRLAVGPPRGGSR